MDKCRNVTGRIIIVDSKKHKRTDSQEEIGESASPFHSGPACVVKQGTCSCGHKKSVALDLDVPEFDGERHALRGKRQHTIRFLDEQMICFRFDHTGDVSLVQVEKEVEQSVVRKFDDRNEQLSAAVAGQLHLNRCVGYETLIEKEAVVAQFETAHFVERGHPRGIFCGIDECVDVVGIEVQGNKHGIVLPGFV